MLVHIQKVQLLCLVVTFVIYILNKKLYQKWHTLFFMPLVFTPTILVIFVLTQKISWADYSAESYWLVWLLGPATIAFAVPVYENMAMIRQHWKSIAAGVVTALILAVTSSVWLARLFYLPDLVQRSLAVRSVTTPFALAAVKSFGGEPNLAAFFVVLTGVVGVAVGDALFLLLSIRHAAARGAGLGGASHGAGTARSYEMGKEEGVIASLVMMFSGVCLVVFAPLFLRLLF